jgi:hypothetical protein
MTTLVFTYDLRKEETSADYKDLIDEIERLGGHRHQKSAWLLDPNNTAKEASCSRGRRTRWLRRAALTPGARPV